MNVCDRNSIAGCSIQSFRQGIVERMHAYSFVVIIFELNKKNINTPSCIRNTYISLAVNVKGGHYECKCKHRTTDDVLQLQ